MNIFISILLLINSDKNISFNFDKKVSASGFKLFKNLSFALISFLKLFAILSNTLILSFIVL